MSPNTTFRLPEKPLELHIPPCIRDPAHPKHFPPFEMPLRINIEGPITAIQRLVLEAEAYIPHEDCKFPQPAGPALARITFETLYGRKYRPDVVGDLVVRDEYLGRVEERKQGRITMERIDYYGVTFDHLVPPEDDSNPEVLQININELDYDGGAYAEKYLPFKVNVADYIGKKVLAVPRCCQHRKGTQDQSRINGLVAIRDGKATIETAFKDR